MKLSGTNATSNNVSISFDSLPPDCLSSAWNLSPEKFVEPVDVEEPDWSNAPLRGEMLNKLPTSAPKKLPGTNATSNNVSISFDSLPPDCLSSAWNLSPEKYHESIEDSGWSGNEWTAEWPNGDEFEAEEVVVEELLTANEQTEKQQKT